MFFQENLPAIQLKGGLAGTARINGGNFYMSILQLFQVEKKIRCSSLFQQNSLHKPADLNTKQSIFTKDCGDSTEDLTWLRDWVMQTQVNEISGDDAAVTYYVAGYIGRYISRRRNCIGCKDLLIDRENIPSLGDVSEVKDFLLAMVDRGGLSSPKQYCFAICALGVQIYSKLRSNDSIQKEFLCLNNQRAAFVSVRTEVVKQNADQYEFLLNQTCNEDIAILRQYCSLFSTALQKTN